MIWLPAYYCIGNKHLCIFILVSGWLFHLVRPHRFLLSELESPVIVERRKAPTGPPSPISFSEGSHADRHHLLVHWLGGGRSELASQLDSEACEARFCLSCVIHSFQLDDLVRKSKGNWLDVPKMLCSPQTFPRKQKQGQSPRFVYCLPVRDAELCFKSGSFPVHFCF